MPYKVVICDDEPYIADATEMLLSTQSEWELDTARYYAPRQALERIEEGRVDILIVDIRMPGINGLQIMRRTSELWPAAHIILLTAHPDFNYVYEAIRYDHVSYVLKSDGHTALLQAVRRAIEKLERFLETRRIVEKAQDRLAEALPLLQRELLVDLIHGSSFSAEQLARICVRLQFPLGPAEPFSMWIGLMQTYTNEDTFIDRNDRLHLIDSAIRCYLPESARFLSILLDNQRILCLVQTKDQTSLPSAQLEGILEGAQQALSAELKLPFSAAYIAHVPQLSQIKSAYDTLKAIHLSMVSAQSEQWLMGADDKNEPPRASRLMDGQYPGKARLFRHAFENGDPSALSQLDALLSPIEAAREMDDPQTIEMYVHLAIQVAALIRNGNLPSYADGGVSLRRLLLPNDHHSPLAAAQYIRDAVQIIDQARTEHASSSMRTIVSTVIAHIQAHLGGDVSLVTLADVAGINASYLSRLFKRATGETLSSYVTTAKMNEAYRLLQGTTRILDISQALGFPSPAYFSFFFKKNAGLPPSEYRSRWHARN
ncbi:MAG TPA: response regulator [Clostridia bacterium]|nr:response regulator [Clostridia bacterium]